MATSNFNLHNNCWLYVEKIKKEHVISLQEADLNVLCTL